MSLREPIRYFQIQGHELVTGSHVDPVATAELIDILRLDDDSDSALLSMLIKSAVSHIEEIVGISLINKTFRLTVDRLPNSSANYLRSHVLMRNDLHNEAYSIRLPRAPLVNVTALTIDGTSYTPSDYFIIDGSQRRPRLIARDDVSFPVINSQAAGITIDYTAGYGTNRNQVPHDIRLSILMLAGFLYEHRGECEIGDAFKKSGAKSLISNYMTTRI